MRWVIVFCLFFHRDRLVSASRPVRKLILRDRVKHPSTLPIPVLHKQVPAWVKDDALGGNRQPLLCVFDSWSTLVGLQYFVGRSPAGSLCRRIGGRWWWVFVTVIIKVLVGLSLRQDGKDLVLLSLEYGPVARKTRKTKKTYLICRKATPGTI